jgi:hypothetical protein
MCCERLKIAFCWIQRPFFLQAQRFGGNESDNPHLRRQYTERARRVGATCLGAFAMAYGARAGACRRGTSALRRYDGAASGRYGAGLPPGDRCGLKQNAGPADRLRHLPVPELHPLQRPLGGDNAWPGVSDHGRSWRPQPRPFLARLARRRLQDFGATQGAGSRIDGDEAASDQERRHRGHRNSPYLTRQEAGFTPCSILNWLPSRSPCHRQHRARRHRTRG